MIDYTKILSSRVREVKPSGIRKFFDLLNTVEGVTALTVGQPDFVTPWHIREAGIRSLEHGKTYYTANSGLAELRSEIANYLERRFSLTYDPSNEIIVTVGGSEAIDIAIRTFVETGDEVIVPTPSFVCYDPLASLAGANVVTIPTLEKDRFRLTADALRAAITEKTKLLILPFPNNPTGAIMEREDLEAIAEVLRGTDIMVLSDEIYAEMTYGGKHHISFASIPDMRERTVVINGFSKAYAMTGWRMGYVCAPHEVIAQMYKIHQYGIMCAPTTSQFAATEAVRNGDEDIAYMTAEYNRRRTLIVQGLRALGLECFEPEGAFYVFPNIGKYGLSSEEFCERLLYEHKVAIVPGTAFGACGEGYARISYAYSVRHILEALEKISDFIEVLKKEGRGPKDIIL
ncbi:MAG: aminotransferase class I/II-fold pyridoxal phosphate-dependent enzyme [Clostridia bacterium]|nr:aminotransferase class I/II-fold pyridoxal phosphate-dependent enzyme [Clostridia bacterium]